MIFAKENKPTLHKFLLLSFCWMLTLSLSGQDRTVGIFLNDSLSLNGYTLFAPSGAKETYLIDNCGHVVNTWTSNFRPGLSVYLLEDGSLLRPCRINSEFNEGGTAGRIEKYNWEGNMIWGFNYSTEWVHQHHDIAPLPNGNLLLLAWEKKSKAEAILAGRNPSTILEDEMWSEHIVEWKIVGNSPPEIVWEWHVWDHLIQDFDSEKNNYGIVEEHPERFNLNFSTNSNVDWLHCNGIDYNPVLDQIILSSRDWNEFWVIDHSTSTEEAASDSGGKYQKGGDLLYRWGNPRTYGRGNTTDQKLFGQHHVTWIPEGLPGEGNVLLFNNGFGRFDGPYSTVEEIVTPINADGTYHLENGSVYGPDQASWIYPEVPDFSFFASRISGAQRLSNGNTLICDGTKGVFFEVTIDGEKVWEYVCPLRQGVPIIQGGKAEGNATFRVERFEENFSAFMDRDLSPGEVIELDSLPDNCGKTIVSINDIPPVEGVQVFPNPMDDFIQLENQRNIEIRVTIVDITGRKRFELETRAARLSIPTYDWPDGVYFARVAGLENNTLIEQSSWVLSKISQP